MQKTYPIYGQNGRNQLKLIPYLWPKQPKNHTLWAAHTYIAHIREYPPRLKPPPFCRFAYTHQRLLTSKYFLHSTRKQNASMLFCSMQIISQNVTQHYYLLDTLVNNYLPKYFPINIQNKFGEKEHLRQKYFCDILSISKKCGRKRFTT